jgi:APA family basic amino acid/polyamine antiporter
MTSTTSRPSTLSKGHLLRILDVSFGLAVIVGGAIGSGILRTPGLVASQLRTRLIIAIWFVGGIYAFCCTLSVIELGTMLPRAGGWYVYSRRACGEYAGFLVGCIDWIAQPVSFLSLDLVRDRAQLGHEWNQCLTVSSKN